MTAQTVSIKKREAQVFPNVTWEQSEVIEQAFEPIPGVKFAYLDGVLEIMPIGEDHEDFKSTIALLLEAYFRAMQIRFYKRGGPTLGSRSLGARSEPDESYNLGTRKPYPDLVLEVVFSSGGVDKLEIYRRLGVAEVWFWEDGVFTFHALHDSGYEQVSRSELLPDLPIDLLGRYVTYHDQYDAVTEFLAAISP